MRNFEAVIYEKAEHWTFNTTVQAKDEDEARAKLAKTYAAKRYSIREVR